NVSGTLIKSGGTGTSVIAVKAADSGSMEAASGTLDFKQKITGAGAMSVDAGAILEADSSAASTLTATFNGAGGVLALKTPSKFAATIAGFALGDTIDLLGKAATSATLGAGDTLVITNGSKAVATLQLTGNYAGDTFAVASDGHGGTSVTVATSAPIQVAPAASHRFVSAMAGFGGGAGAALAPVAVHSDAWRPMLTAPRFARLA
ncbi:MAG: hypothetical protein ACR2F8_10725, partial [Caulobacteraceae bacterium]